MERTVFNLSGVDCRVKMKSDCEVKSHNQTAISNEDNIGSNLPKLRKMKGKEKRIQKKEEQEKVKKEEIGVRLVMQECMVQNATWVKQHYGS